MATGLQKGRLFAQIWKAARELNPRNVAAEAGKTVRIGALGTQEQLQWLTAALVGDDPAAYDTIGDALVLVTAQADADGLDLLAKCDLVAHPADYDGPLPRISARRTFGYEPGGSATELINRILESPSLDYAHLPLAREFQAFREAESQRIIQSTSIENAVFVTSTSLGNIIPNPLQALTSVAEALGDTVVLTANQIRMLFRLAAIHGHDPALKKQAPEVGSVVAAAFGWRSMARELVSKIPVGGGVVPKAAIAFAGTWAIGDGLDYFYRTGRKLSKQEIRRRFDASMDKGRAVAQEIAGKVRKSYERKKPGTDGTGALPEG